MADPPTPKQPMTRNQARWVLVGISAFVLALMWFAYPEIPIEQRDGLLPAAAVAAVAAAILFALAVLFPWRGRLARISSAAIQPYMYGLLGVLMLVLDDLRVVFIGAFGAASGLVTIALLTWAKDEREEKKNKS
jgi:O-antigen/teichoic acid export membrane protein